MLLVDGHALMHRGFHAIPHLSTKSGEPTNAIYGFTLLLLRAIKELDPIYVVVTFDLPQRTFRDEIYSDYKANRSIPPENLIVQIPRVKDLVKTLNIPIYEIPGYEADDLIGSLAKQVSQKYDIDVVIVTGDMDTLQLVDDRIKVFAPKKGMVETQTYGEPEVIKKFGLNPKQLVDYKALRGDPTDNIPGVKGIGEKTAIELLQEFETLENIYSYLAHAHEPSHAPHGSKGTVIRPRIAKLLETYRENAFMSQKLGRIVCDIDIDLDLEKARLADYDQKKVHELFFELEFRSLLDKLPKSSSDSMIPEHHKRETGGYQLIDTEAKFIQFFREFQNQKTFALDTETTSLKPFLAKLVGIGFSWKSGEAYYIPETIITSRLVEYLERDDLILIGQNIKYDYLVLQLYGITLKGKFFDTMVAAYLLNPGSRNLDLDSLTFNEFGFRKTSTESLIGKGKNQITMAEVDVQKVSDYCCEDADYTWRLAGKLRTELEEKSLKSIFLNIEMPLIPVLASMEKWGIKLDPKILENLSIEAKKEIGKLETRIYSFAGSQFNIGSPLQLKAILFDQLHIPTDNLKKGKTGLSTAATELEKLRGLHPIIDLIFEWRELTKLKNTYLDALPLLIDPGTHRIHSSFNQTIAATGRLSSTDPNLQNIPIRTALGRKVRSAFIAEHGYKLVSVDYSQIELRLAAHLSEDERMIKIFVNGGDIHTVTAQEIFGVKDQEAVTDDMRRSAKTINFGVLYGLSAHGLSSRIPGISHGVAQDFIDKYFQTYPKLTAYLEDITAKARVTGYVKNEIGRVRYLPEIKSSNWQIRAGAERAAINMPFQSMNADIIKMAMNKLAEAGLNSRDDCRLLLQVHDELVFEIHENQLHFCIKQIKTIMQDIYKLKVPLVVEAKVGDNWEEMDKVILNTGFPFSRE